MAPLDTVQSCLARIADLDGELRAWARVDAEGALARARRLAALSAEQRDQLPLFGAVFGVKDIFDTAGLETEWGSPLYRGRIPRTSAALVARLESLGAITLGKTHTTAFAYFDPGPTRNPHDADRTPGGSSSGSAAAVAAGMVPLAIGSQTMGSVLRPASYCGVVGFKPTFGKLPLQGVLPFAPSLDHAGVFARSVPEIESVWRALCPADPPTADEPALFHLPWPIQGVLEPEMATGLEQCLVHLSDHGMHVESAPLSDGFPLLPEAIGTVLAAEAEQIHRGRFAEHGVAIGAKLAELVARGAAVSPDSLREARATIENARREFAHWLPPPGIVLTPAALGEAPRGLGSTGDPRANAPWTALGVPAISIPFGFSPAGLPLV